MSSEHPWRGNQQETGHAALAPRGEVKAGGVTLAAPTKVRVGAVGMDEGEKNSLDQELLESKGGLSHFCVCFWGDASQIFMNIGP